MSIGWRDPFVADEQTMLDAARASPTLYEIRAAMEKVFGALAEARALLVSLSALGHDRFVCFLA